MTIRYIIWTTTNQESIELRELLKPKSSIILPINDVITCIETKITQREIRGSVGEDMEIACLEVDEKFIRDLLTKSPLPKERKNFLEFLRMTKTPRTINEALDLINDRGGLEFLNERELHALDRLTSHFK